MLVENKTTHIIAQGLRVDKGSQVPRVRTVTLLPGISEVADADWELVKGHAGIQARIDDEELIERDSRPLAKRAEKEAVKLIKLTVDVQLLKSWGKEEQRPEVKKAISTQIDTLTLSAEDKNKASEE